MTIDHQENVGRKREKRKYGATQEKAAGTGLRILLVMKITFGAKRTGEERKPRGTTLFAGAGCAGRPSRRLGECPRPFGRGTLLLRRCWGGRAALARLGGGCSPACAKYLLDSRSPRKCGEEKSKAKKWKGASKSSRLTFREKYIRRN